GCPLRPVKYHFTVLTVPRAHSRIHRITKFTLKRADISQQQTDAANGYTTRLHWLHNRKRTVEEI
ncbi:hypothetical protein ACPWLH_005273, partial [Escherichia coli]